AEHRRRDDQRLALRAGNGLDQADLGARISLALVDELADQLTHGTFRSGQARIDRLQHQSSSSSSLARPLLTSRATTKPTTAAPASAMPGLLRTKLRVSSINSSGSLVAILFATFSIAPAARRA